jgi:hypothetical protein
MAVERHQGGPRALFGELLVRQRLITQEQLDRAIAHQQGTGALLGEILAEWNLITHQHVQEVLHRQRRLRTTAAFIGALMAPLQALAMQPIATAAVVATMPALRPLDDSQLEEVSGQGLQEELVRHIRHQLRGNGVDVIGDMAKLINPVLGFLESDLALRGVTFDPANAVTRMNADGSITLALPTTIGELSLSNIRIRGADPAGPSFGSITMKGIDLTGTTITLALRP